MSADVSLNELLHELAQQRAFDFRGYKRTTLERRFRRRMFQLSLGTYAEYRDYIRKHPDENNKLLNTILINVTEFFRDLPAWEIVSHEILPSLLKSLKPGHSFRVWSAGCASGEEPYCMAMLLSEHFGSRMEEYDVKIYATDIDEEALTIGRRGEYSAEALRRVRPEWWEKYFHGKGPFRVNREIRRLVIFGRSNLAHDAPISHVNLLICRNVLIYFDSELQKRILGQFHYALDPGGIMFLGKSESQLTNSSQFRRINARWRIFKRMTGDDVTDNAVVLAETRAARKQPVSQDEEDLEGMRLHNRNLLETLRVGVFVLGPNDSIIQNNSAALTLCGLNPADLSGKRLQDTDVFMRIPDVGAHLHTSRISNESSRFEARIKTASAERLLEIIIRPIVSERGQRNGTFVYVDDITVREKLRMTVEELESTGTELQSANEELETTNEELQSTNEELETTNEELQSTNEELETTNEELQSLNEELETTNQELEERTKELDQVNDVYLQTLQEIRLPVMLVNQERCIEFWNNGALRVFGFKSKPPVDLTIEQLPLSEELRKLLIRRHQTVLLKGQPLIARAQPLGGKLNSTADIHFSVLPKEDRSKSVLIIFEPVSGDGEPAKKKSTKSRVS
jgi:two-component system, chemotaxis family, CheB/CheR fusion protein